MEENTQTPKTQVTNSLQEMKQKYGKVSVGIQKMKRSDGSEFDSYGLKFGSGVHSCFAAFSGRISHDDQSQRDEQFRGLNPTQVGQKVWADKDNFQILHKKDPVTKELLYHKDANGSPKLDKPILVCCHYNDFTEELVTLDE